MALSSGGCTGHSGLSDGASAVDVRDERLIVDRDYLGAIDAGAGTIIGWGVDEHGGLAPIGSWGDLPTTAAGLAAR